MKEFYRKEGEKMKKIKYFSRIMLVTIIMAFFVFSLINGVFAVSGSDVRSSIDDSVNQALFENRTREVVGLSNGSILGMVILRFVIIIAIIVLIVFFVKKGKKKKQTEAAGKTTVSKYSDADKQVARDYKIDSWGELIKIIVISGVCGLIGYWIGDAARENVVMYAFLGAGFPWGYSVISKIIDDWVELYAILASSVLWLIVFIIKIALSIFLGAIIMPIKLILSIYHIIEAQKFSKEVNKEVEIPEAEQITKTESVDNKDEKVENKTDNSKDEVQKIKDLKELLDEGIISKEEFESKKKELLNKM